IIVRRDGQPWISPINKPAQSLRTDQHLSASETETLDDLESTIEEGLDKFKAVVKAFLTIKGEVFYKESGTFEKYLQERWKISINDVDRAIRGLKTQNPEAIKKEKSAKRPKRPAPSRGSGSVCRTSPGFRHALAARLSRVHS